MPRPDLYFSVDIEADGPIPGPYSMVSLGACVAGTYDGVTFTAIDPEAHTFYAELKPISDQWDREALAVSGLSRETLLAEGADPKTAMTDFVSWVEAQCAAHDRGRAVFAAFPLGFDWLFTYHYLIAYAAGRRSRTAGTSTSRRCSRPSPACRSTRRSSAACRPSSSAAALTRTTRSTTRRVRPTCWPT